jgi:hypothetical protein
MTSTANTSISLVSKKNSWHRTHRHSDAGQCEVSLMQIADDLRLARAAFDFNPTTLRGEQECRDFSMTLPI